MSLGSSSLAEDIEALTRPRPRVRSGCLTCRRRKVKCDEQRPVCYNCNRLKRTCIYGESSVSGRYQSATRQEPTRRTSSTVGVGTAASTSPQGASPPFILSELGWTPPPNLVDFGAVELPNGFGLTSPNFSWSQAPVLNDTASLALAPATPQILNNATFSYFLEHVEPPFIANVDDLNWKLMKKYMVDLGCRHPVVSQALFAVESLYKAAMSHDKTANSMAAYYAAKSGYMSLLERDGDDPETILIVTLLLCCFEIVAQHEAISITLKPDGALVTKLEAWGATATTDTTSAVLRRLQVWFRILHARTLHLGGRGLLSPTVSRILKGDYRDQTPSLLEEEHIPGPEQAMVADLSSTLFEFYLKLQDISIQITGLNRHHRSRGFQTDEMEVKHTAESIQETLHRIWQRRPALLRADSRYLREQLSPTVRSSLCRLVDLCRVSYFTEIIYLGRAYGKTPTAAADALEAMKHIRDIVDSRLQRSTMDPGFIWPLFMYAVEHPDPDHSRWAVGALHEVKNPVWHSEFVASLAQGISEKQFAGSKRVDTRYFCLENYSTPPPFI